MAEVSGILWLLMIAALPFLCVVSAAIGILGVGRNKNRSAKEVANYLRSFIEGNGGEWDWDDFTSVPIKDPVLESIRYRADMVKLPVTEAGLEELRKLLGQAEEIVTEINETPNRG